MRFSIVIPYRNRASWLSRTLESIANQTFMDFELLLVDNGSTDVSSALCRDFAMMHADSPFSVRLLTEPVEGASRARNLGLREAKADYVYFFDSDDEISPMFLTEADELLKHRPDLQLVCGRTVLCWPDGKREVRKVVESSNARDQILCSMLTTQGMIIERNFLVNIGGWNESLPKWNDWELGVRILMRTPKMAWLKGGPYHHIHQHSESLTGLSWAATYESLRPSLEAVRQLASESKSLRRALACREAVIAAELSIAGRNAEADALLVEAQELCSTITWCYAYRRLGGRGTWRLFRFFYR